MQRCTIEIMRLENIRYIYNVKFRLFLDAQILEVKETGLHAIPVAVRYKRIGKRSVLKSLIIHTSVQEKLTKSLLVHEWLNKLVILEYTFNQNPMNSSNPITNPSFRKLFTAQIIALVGTGLSTVGLSLLAYNLAGDNAGAVLRHCFGM